MNFALHLWGWLCNSKAGRLLLLLAVLTYAAFYVFLLHYEKAAPPKSFVQACFEQNASRNGLTDSFEHPKTKAAFLLLNACEKVKAEADRKQAQAEKTSLYGLACKLPWQKCTDF